MNINPTLIHFRSRSPRRAIAPRRAVLIPFVLVALAGCTRGASGDSELAAKPRKAPPAARDSATIRSAELALRHFLDASREGSTTRDSLAVLTNCGDPSGESYFPSTLLAGYSLMPSDIHGDTVVGRAAVVTVAEQDIDRRGSGFTARQRVREDVLEWDVIPSDDLQHWTVCNGLRFGYLGADSLTTWRPDGASYATARALVDSIVKARGN